MARLFDVNNLADLCRELLYIDEARLYLENLAIRTIGRKFEDEIFETRPKPKLSALPESIKQVVSFILNEHQAGNDTVVDMEPQLRRITSNLYYFRDNLTLPDGVKPGQVVIREDSRLQDEKIINRLAGATFTREHAITMLTTSLRTAYSVNTFFDSDHLSTSRAFYALDYLFKGGLQSKLTTPMGYIHFILMPSLPIEMRREKEPLIFENLRLAKQLYDEVIIRYESDQFKKIYNSITNGDEIDYPKRNALAFVGEAAALTKKISDYLTKAVELIDKYQARTAEKQAPDLEDIKILEPILGYIHEVHICVDIYGFRYEYLKDFMMAKIFEWSPEALAEYKEMKHFITRGSQHEYNALILDNKELKAENERLMDEIAALKK